jgi:hypothetical protein
LWFGSPSGLSSRNCAGSFGRRAGAVLALFFEIEKPPVSVWRLDEIGILSDFHQVVHLQVKLLVNFLEHRQGVVGFLGSVAKKNNEPTLS